MNSTNYKIHNVGFGQPVSVKRMIEVIEKLLLKQADILYKPVQAGDVRNTCADERELRKEFNHTPVDFVQGMREFVTWYVKYKNNELCRGQ